MSAITFAVLGLILCLSAVGTARTQNLVHSVFWLASTLISTAGLFVLLGAPFLAGIQIMLYTGGVITLMLFGIMLTKRTQNTLVPAESHHQRFAFIAASALFMLLNVSIWGTPAFAELRPQPAVSTQAIGAYILSEQLIAFEALSVLLLAALIGAIVLARRSDP